jgi:predicted nucleotidyltransferase
VAPEPASQFVDAASNELGDNLVAVLMVGSFARGEQASSSDLDLCVLVNRIDLQVLRAIGELVTSIATPNEINPAVVSIDELRAYPDLFEIHKLRHEGVLLWGGMPNDIVPVESELILAKRIASEVLMSSRHYLAVAEPSYKFTSGKLRPWNLKPLSFALRYYHFHKTGRYLRRFTALAEKYPLLELDPVADHQQIIQGCIDVCEEILSA